MGRGRTVGDVRKRGKAKGKGAIVSKIQVSGDFGGGFDLHAVNPPVVREAL